MGELKKLILVDPAKTGATLKKMLREAHDSKLHSGEVDDKYYRLMFDGFALLLRYYAYERDNKQQDDIADIKAILKERGLLK